MAEIDADIPGVVDARLAGWRVDPSHTAAADDGAAENSSASSEAESPGDGEPGCGDVVEVCLAISNR